MGIKYLGKAIETSFGLRDITEIFDDISKRKIYQLELALDGRGKNVEKAWNSLKKYFGLLEKLPNSKFKTESKNIIQAIGTITKKQVNQNDEKDAYDKIKTNTYEIIKKIENDEVLKEFKDSFQWLFDYSEKRVEEITNSNKK